ncbi:hypothetical protein KIW84_030658 [Lathyrus oleraceus]|uniref:Integrase catalytic domain-containing protein n=1 Tax=Pisum sativum TaxID=3888 RepID=A0A9D4XT89_PEA|nr:hypothetical protein KIW84_030658 [Pisum sativum]
MTGFTARRIVKLYVLDTNSTFALSPTYGCVNTFISNHLDYAKNDPATIWYFRLGHLSPHILKFDADNWEPLSTPSTGGHKYSLTLVDDYSSDNGSEFLMTSFHLSRGIIHHRSYVEIPQQNGIVERKDQHISNVAHVISFQSHRSHNLWHLSIQQAIHIINRLPTAMLNNLTPYQMLHSIPPSLIHLRFFGCLAYSSTLHNHRTKFEPRARKCIFLGYREGTKGYLLYDPITMGSMFQGMLSSMEMSFPLPHLHMPITLSVSIMIS